MKKILRDQCTGCTACVNICPKKCLKMVADSEGFLYPEMEKSNCIECGLCEKVCPIGKSDKHLPLHVFAAKNLNENVRLNSTSGGVFSSISEYVLEKNGVVFGCKLSENLEAEHTFSESAEGMEQFRGAKYSQSKLGESFKKVKHFLSEGRLVLFTGTPCQVAGLDSFLGKKYDNLIKCDLVCHSVPSPKALRKYIDELEDKHKRKVINFSFRNKEMYGWKKSNIKVVFEDGFVHEEFLKETSFMKGFNQGLFNRSSCADCSYKDFNGVSDITIADYWGIENVDSDFADNIGVSLVFINTDVGNILFNNIKTKIEIIETNVENAVGKNPYILTSSSQHKNRKEFFNRIDNESFSDLVCELLDTKGGTAR